MPQPLSIDRELFRGLVLQGFSALQVANKLGMKPTTARTWIKRLGLRCTEAKVKAELATDGKNELAVSIANDEAQRARKLVGKAIARDVAFLADAPATTTSAQAYKRYTQLAPLLTGAERVLAWRADDAGPATINLSRIDIHYASADHDSMPASIGSNPPVDSLQEDRLQRGSVIDATPVSSGQVSPVVPLQEPSIAVESQVDATTLATDPGDSPPSST